MQALPLSTPLGALTHAPNPAATTGQPCPNHGPVPAAVGSPRLTDFAPIEEPATASTPSPTVSRDEDHGSRLVLSAQAGLTLDVALREPVAWIKPETRHSLAFGTMSECPTSELEELCVVLAQFPTARDHRRLALAKLVLADRAHRLES